MKEDGKTSKDTLTDEQKKRVAALLWEAVPSTITDEDIEKLFKFNELIVRKIKGVLEDYIGENY